MGLISDGLRQDHEDMRTIVAVLMEMANRADDGGSVSAEDLNDLLRYMDMFVTRCHHAKEELLLFPALEEAGIQREDGPLAIMTAEHQLEQNFLDGMHDAAGRMASGERAASKIVAQYARDYASLLARDMEQEDQIIYPLAEQRLNGRTQQELVDKFDELETQVLGVGKHDNFHKLAHKLGERYLN